jgi:Zn-dependent protease with chaperone function
MDPEATAKCSCAHCGTHLEFALESAGEWVSCPNCLSQTELTLALPPRVEADGPSAAELVAAFGGPIKRVRVSFFYQLGLVLVAVMMLLLPVLYILLIALAGSGVYWYATHCWVLFSFLRTGLYLMLLKAAICIGPIFAGVALVFFMIKPLFARRMRQAKPLGLNPAVEPRLYAFVCTICDLTGAPMPKRIQLDCQLNASAGFANGWSGLFKNDLVLTIGLPLAAGLNLREFAGLIAHEFGHFTQGFGMRLSFLIRGVNLWFARVVYVRDSWDAALEEWSAEVDSAWSFFVVVCIQVAVGFARLVLKLLMFLGHAVSCFFVRQMEYHADVYEIRVSGSAGFESATRRFAELSEGLGLCYKEIRTGWNLNRRLPDNLPNLVVERTSKIPPAVRERLQDTLGLRRTKWFETHPSDGDRIRQARRAGDPGVFHREQPARILFSNFDVAARQVTHLHYVDDLRIPLGPANLEPRRKATETA